MAVSIRSTNQKVVLVGQAQAGPPQPGMFAIVEDEVDVDSLDDGEVLLRNVYLSLDPSIYAYSLRAVPPNSIVEARAVSVVFASRSSELSVGDVVWGTFGWELFTKLPAALIDRRGHEVKPNVISPALWRKSVPLSWALSVLGVPGLAAWGGLVQIAQLKAGEQVYISSAAGAVGLIAGQIAKALGCYVVGSAGSDEKCRMVKELGFDSCFNYKRAVGVTDPMCPEAVQGISMELMSCCPNGIDVYFDTVGGPTLDAVLLQANSKARVVVCGMTSQYLLNDGQPRYGARFLPLLVEKKISIGGFQVQEFFDLMPKYLEQMTRWIDEGKIQYKDTIIDDLRSVPDAFCNMMQGRYSGKTIVRVSEDAFASGWSSERRKADSVTHRDIGCQASWSHLPEFGDLGKHAQISTI